MELSSQFIRCKAFLTGLERSVALKAMLRSTSLVCVKLLRSGATQVGGLVIRL